MAELTPLSSLVPPLMEQIEQMAPRARRIFVFGSNEAGIHGAGSAVHAVRFHGAEYGVGSGLTGNAYAIPTKKDPRTRLSIAEIAEYVRLFLAFAHSHPAWRFDVVKIGCGLAGHDEAYMAPLFRGAPDNVVLPDGWRQAEAA